MCQPGLEKGFGGEWIHMAESLCCLPDTTTALLTGCNPIQNKKVKKKKKNTEHIK